MEYLEQFGLIFLSLFLSLIYFISFDEYSGFIVLYTIGLSVTSSLY